jgi:hypothetical protein
MNLIPLLKKNYKIFLFFLLSSLLPLLFVGSYSYIVAERSFQHTVLNHLKSYSEVQKERVELIFDRYDKGFVGIESHPDLMPFLLKESFESEDITAIRDIIEECVRSLPYLTDIFIVDNGILLGSVESPDFSTAIMMEHISDRSVPHVMGFIPVQDGFDFLVASPVLHDGISNRFLVARFSGQAFLDVTDTYMGLGETGETLFGIRTTDDHMMFLTKARHKPDSLFQNISLSRTDIPMVKAVIDQEEILLGGFIDYKGKKVFAVDLSLKMWGADWGLVVKMDRDEIYSPIDRLKLIIIFSVIGTIFMIAILYVFIMVNFRIDLKFRK